DLAEAQLGGVVTAADGIAADARAALVEAGAGLTVFNSLSWDRRGIIPLPKGMAGLVDEAGQPVPAQVQDGKTFAEVTIPACGWAGFGIGKALIPESAILATPNSLENDLLRIEFNEFGEISSVFDKIERKELAAGLCNRFRMYQDIPSAFDAWDIDSMYKLSPVELPEKAEITVSAGGPLFGSLVISRKLNESTLTQTVTLRRDSRQVDFHTVVDWQERHKLLKVDFPVDYHVQEALHEIQFGHLARPTHRSRQIDQDRFEVCNQKWTALVEPERGFAILNDSKYGVDVFENSINLTLLKSALAPDMTADRGWQEFTYAFTFWNTPLAESDLVREGYELNIPLQVTSGTRKSASLFRVSKANIIIETVKPAEEPGAGDVVVRCYEALGNTTRAALSTSLPFTRAYLTDMLETPLEELALEEGEVALEFHPFEIKTLRFAIGKGLAF
ncbi:MAG: alpha-mannosidase, partial [Anaerolineaceae bacterium]|nr:alpha-mannosidase [Anaerolineaceae bacterium]